MTNQENLTKENPNPVLRISRNYELIYANKPALNLLKINKIKTGKATPEKYKKIIKETLQTNKNKIVRIELKERLFECIFSPNQNKGFVNVFGTDITLRVNTEKQIYEEKERAQKYLNLAGSMIIALDNKGKIELINKKGYETLGYNKGELIGKNWFETCIPKSERAKTKNIFQKCLTGKIENNEHVQNKIITKEGKVKLINWYNTLIKENGKIVGTISSGEDITNRDESKEVLRNIINLLPTSIFWKDKELNYLGCNKRFAQDAGYESPDDLIGKNDLQMAWKEQADLYREDDRKVINSGKSKLNIDEPQTTPEGKTIWLRTNKVPLKQKDKIIGILGMYEDVTQVKQQEIEKIRLSRIAEQNPALLILTNKGGQFEFVNDKFIEITGYTLKDLKGKTPRILKSGKTSKKEYENLWKTISSGKTWKGEFQNKKKNGEFYWASAQISPILDEKGEIINYLGMQQDITNQKISEQKLQMKIEEMQKFQDLTVGRELKMIELKKEVNSLLKKLNKESKYQTE